MKYFIACLFVFVSSEIVGQSKNQLEFKFSPIGINVGNIHIKEYGLGHYKFNPKNGLNLATSIVYSHKIFKPLYIEVGLGLKLVDYKFSYEITNPFDNQDILSTEERYHKRIMWCPHFGLSYSKEKWKFSLAYEPHFELTKSTNIGTRYGGLEFFVDLATQRSAYFTISEVDLFTDDIFLFGIPSMDISYSINPKFSLNLSSLIKPYGQWPLYQLRIHGKTADMADGTYILNNIRISNKFLMVFLGVTYQLSNKSILPGM